MTLREKYRYCRLSFVQGGEGRGGYYTCASLTLDKESFNRRRLLVNVTKAQVIGRVEVGG